MSDLSFVQLVVPGERKRVVIVHILLENQLWMPLRAQGKRLRSFPKGFYFPLEQEKEERKISIFQVILFPSPSHSPVLPHSFSK